MWSYVVQDLLSPHFPFWPYSSMHRKHLPLYVSPPPNTVSNQTASLKYATPLLSFAVQEVCTTAFPFIRVILKCYLKLDHGCFLSHIRIHCYSLSYFLIIQQKMLSILSYLLCRAKKKRDTSCVSSELQIFLNQQHLFMKRLYLF